jgi:hypothetical protein
MLLLLDGTLLLLQGCDLELQLGALLFHFFSGQVGVGFLNGDFFGRFFIGFFDDLLFGFSFGLFF